MSNNNDNKDIIKIDGVINIDFGEEQEPIIIDSSYKRKITKPKIIVGAIFTLGLGAYIASQKYNIQLLKIPKISIVNDANGSNYNIPFLNINPGSIFNHIDYTKVTKSGKDNVVMKITAIDYKKKDLGGFGDGVMVQSNGEYLLMDTYSSQCLPNVISYLKENGIKKFNIYISHNHDDHTDNLIKLVKQFDIPIVYLPNLDSFKKFEKEIKKESPNTKIVNLNKGSKFKVGECDGEVLFGPEFKGTSDENNQSLITRITTPQGVRFLSAGDAEKELEEMALKAGIDLSADIYKMSHHGGKSSNTDDFVKAVNPSYFFYNYNNGGHGAKEKKFGNAGWIKNPVNALDELGNGASVLMQGQLDWVIYGSTKIEFSAAKSNTTEQVTFTQTINGKEVKFTHILTKGSSHKYTEQMKKADEIEYRNMKKTSKLYDLENHLNAREMVKKYKPPLYKTKKEYEI